MFKASKQLQSREKQISTLTEKLHESLDNLNSYKKVTSDMKHKIKERDEDITRLKEQFQKMKKQYVHFSQKVSESEDTSEIEISPPKASCMMNNKTNSNKIAKPQPKKVEKRAVSPIKQKTKATTVKELKSTVKIVKPTKNGSSNTEAWTGSFTKLIFVTSRRGRTS
jgi:chromosome segregation ATPase